EEGGGSKVIPKFDEVVQDLDPFLGVSADRKVINEQQLDPRIVSDSLTIFAQVFLPVENNQFVQQVAIVYKFTAVITFAGLYAACRQEVGFASTGDPIDPHILPVLSDVEFQDLFNCGIIIDAPVAGFQVLSHSPLVDQAAEPQIGFKPFIESLYVLRFQNLTNELQGGIAAEFRAFRQLRKALGSYRQGQYVQHLIDIVGFTLHSRPPFPDASTGS